MPEKQKALEMWLKVLSKNFSTAKKKKKEEEERNMVH
jgi:hypothetical protein